MTQSAINKFCPRSGKAIQGDSLTTYKGHTVGFCNPGCCQDFATNPQACDSDRAYFDILLKEYELVPGAD